MVQVILNFVKTSNKLDTVMLCIRIQGVDSLRVHAVYLLHGRLLLVPLYSLSKMNNNGSKARWFKLH